MKAIVIGGAGFIGSHLCDVLLKDRNYVICVDNFSLGTKKNIEHLDGNKDFQLYETDASNIEELRGIFKRENPDYVFHMAANSDIRASASAPKVEYINTYSTTFTVLCCMKEFSVKKVFFASTSAVYGDKRDRLLDEKTTELEPISYYGAAKLGSEALISAFAYMNNMEALIFRFPNVIGPRLTHGVIYDFIRKLERNNEYLQILGNGKQIKPYIYVSDLVDAIMMFKNTGKSGVTLYNIGSEGETSVDDIARMICEEMGLTNVKFEYTGGEGGWKGDVPRFQYCLDKVHADGWSAKYTSDEAVRMTIRDNIRE